MGDTSFTSIDTCRHILSCLKRAARPGSLGATQDTGAQSVATAGRMPSHQSAGTT